MDERSLQLVQRGELSGVEGFDPLSFGGETIKDGGQLSLLSDLRKSQRKLVLPGDAAVSASRSGICNLAARGPELRRLE